MMGRRLRMRMCRRLGLGRGLCCWLLYYPELSEKVLEARKKMLEMELELLESILKKKEKKEKQE